MSDYEEHAKCRGCGAHIWGIARGGEPAWEVMHNEANCLASRLDTAAALAVTMAKERKEIEGRLDSARQLFERIYKQLMEGVDGYQRLVTCSDIERWKEGKPLSNSVVEKGAQNGLKPREAEYLASQQTCRHCGSPVPCACWPLV